MRNLLLGLLVLTLPCTLANAEEGAVEHWDRLHIAGAHAGFVHTVVREVEADGAPQVLTTVTTDIKIKRLGSTTHIHSKGETWERPDGTLLRIVTELQQSAQTSKSTFTFTDGKLTQETVVMGNTRKVEREVDEDLVGPEFAARALRALVGTQDEEVRIKTWMADFQKTVESVSTSRGREVTELHDGTTAELTRIDSVLEGVPGFRPVTWVDDAGAVAKTALQTAGILIETYRVSSEEEAVATKVEKASAPDVFAQTMLQEADPIPVPRHLEQATVTVRLRDDTLPVPTFEAAGLNTSSGEDGLLTVTARRVVPAEAKRGVRPLASVPSALRDALAPSSMIQSDAEAIVKTAEEVVGDETSAWVAAQKLERWVFENVTKKNMSVGFATAREVLETREGDCTEHAVLLAALCRAAGIPSRVVMGLEFLFGLWGGHAWNDVWIDGVWYQLDATNGYGFVDPLHLPMAQMVMKEGGASEFIAIMGSIGNLDLDIVSVVRDGRTIHVNDSAKLVVAADGHYRDRIWSLQFDAPAGFVLDTVKQGKRMSARLLELDGKTAEGKVVEIRIDAMDTPAVGGVRSVLNQMKVDPESAVVGTVDGRASHTVTTTRGDRQIIRTLVAADDALFIFTLDRAGAEAERKAFWTFLDGVDFDLE